MKKIWMFISVFILMFLPFSTFVAEDNEPEDRIQEFMDQAIQEYNIPGASLSVIHNGTSIFQNSWGEMSNGEEVKQDTTFLIGSVSKPLTSLAVMMLVEEGKIDLDSPIDDYIPWFTYESLGEEEITVRHLLNLTSGIGVSDGLEVTDNFKSNNNIKGAAERLSGVKLDHPPGEVYVYNSANYLLLGAIIEAVSNQSFGRFMEQHVFSPLGMNNTTADYKSAFSNGFVPGYQSWFGNSIKSEEMYDRTGAPYGYMTSTANDLTNFIDFMISGGEILSEEGLQMLKSPPSEADTHYGFGWHFPKSGEQYPFHTGATPDYRAEVFFLPEEKLGAVLLVNKYHEFEAGAYLSMMEGIRSILNGEDSKLVGLDTSIQWISLSVVFLLIIAFGVSIYRLKKREKMNRRLWLFIGVSMILLAAGVIPLFTIIAGVPWRTFGLFVPDLQFLIKCVVVVVGVYGVIILGMIRKRSNGVIQ
ncbi:beta-lactamase family protein [Sutcliffiella horikoshii]|uniref:serine hydrolase domain-containing protein n=1 Tax=Sutcliffiella horikoshii TaxID=79883 RepID=UPI00384D9C6F